mgnify:CR=1 FL=1
MALESDFQSGLISDIKKMYPDCMVLKNDPNYIQGVPDLAMIECKKSKNAKRQPNQPYYVEMLDKMGFARFAHPENKEEVLHDLQQSFKPSRSARISRSK